MQDQYFLHSYVYKDNKNILYIKYTKSSLKMLYKWQKMSTRFH